MITRSHMTPNDFPTYVFYYESYYGELGEYAYQNKDYFGEDPDYDVVMEELVNLKNDAFIEPLSIELDYFNSKLDVYEISMCRGTLPELYCDIYLQVVAKVRVTDRQMFATAIEEAEKVRTWLESYPEQYGFVRINDPTKLSHGVYRDASYNLRPGTLKKAGRRSRHGIKRR